MTGQKTSLGVRGMMSSRAKVGGEETREGIPILSNLTDLIFVPAIAGQTPENHVGVGLWCSKRIARRQQCRSWAWDKRTSPPKQQILTSEREKRVRNDIFLLFHENREINENKYVFTKRNL